MQTQLQVRVNTSIKRFLSLLKNSVTAKLLFPTKRKLLNPPHNVIGCCGKRTSLNSRAKGKGLKAFLFFFQGSSESYAHENPEPRRIIEPRTEADQAQEDPVGTSSIPEKKVKPKLGHPSVKQHRKKPSISQGIFCSQKLK